MDDQKKFDLIRRLGARRRLLRSKQPLSAEQVGPLVHYLDFIEQYLIALFTEIAALTPDNESERARALRTVMQAYDLTSADEAPAALRELRRDFAELYLALDEPDRLTREVRETLAFHLDLFEGHVFDAPKAPRP
jgi:hypothetical protein